MKSLVLVISSLFSSCESFRLQRIKHVYANKNLIGASQYNKAKEAAHDLGGESVYFSFLWNLFYDYHFKIIFFSLKNVHKLLAEVLGASV